MWLSSRTLAWLVQSPAWMGSLGKEEGGRRGGRKGKDPVSLSASQELSG